MVNLKSIQTEVDAAYLYGCLATHEEDKVIAGVFLQMSEIEKSHADAFLKKSGLSASAMPTPSTRARFLNRMGSWFGYDFVLGILMDTEKSLSNAILVGKRQQSIPITGAETNHVKILNSILEREKGVSATSIARFERRHRSVGGNALRAAVLGGNDGLVSNFSLVMGVAGASANQDPVLLAGMAGLLAGALSMSLGEWISVRSSQELYENQMQLEMDELESNPEGEQKELALIYITKGIPEEQAHKMAADVMLDKTAAHEVLTREELGINPEELKGSAMEAALYSFFFFAGGAILPIIPFFFMDGIQAIVACASLSALGLFLIGAAITLFTGKSAWYSGFRQVIFGLLAAAITFGIGRLIGVSIT